MGHIKMVNFRKLLLITVAIFICATKPAKANSNDTWVNIFIHGTIHPIVTIGDLIRIGQQRVKGTRYHYATKYIRSHDVLHRAQAMQEVGLHEVKQDKKLENYGSKALSDVYKQVSTLLSHENNSLYYTFGWSGLLSYSSRQKAAIFLHNKLLPLVEKLKSEDKNPKVRLIAFSHGGNVALQLANLEDWDPLEVRLPIEELINIGAPVHKETDTLVRHPMFKKIYHFYSQNDIPQKLDFLSTDYNSSHRRFKARKCFDLPDKLTQIQIKYTKSVEKKRPAIPKITHRDIGFDPTHIELWSFGWAAKGHRKTSPIFPLPAAAIVPYLIKLTKDNPQLGTNLSMNIHVDKGEINIRDRKWSDHKTKQKLTLPFFSKHLTKKLKATAWKHFPKHHNKKALSNLRRDAIFFGTRQMKRQRGHCDKVC